MTQRAVCIVILAVGLLLSVPLTAQWCEEQMVHEGAERIVSFDVDTTGRWWAIVTPFQSMVTLIVDGDRYGPYNSVTPPVFSPDGATWSSIAALNGLVEVVSPTPVSLPQATAITHVLYPQQSSTAWYRCANGNQQMFTNGVTTVLAIEPTGAWATDLYGTVLYHVARRGSGQTLVRNDVDGVFADEIKLGGVWHDGRPVYASRAGDVWTLMIGAEEVRSNLRNVTDLQVNATATILGAVVATPLGMHALMHSEEYKEVWLGPQVETVSYFLLNPFQFLCVWEGTLRGVKNVYYNTAPYPAGVSRGPIVFSHDGGVMGYLGRDDDDFVTIDGKRTMLPRRATTGAVPALHPNGGSLAYSTGASMAMLDVESKEIALARICDRVSRTVYDWRRSSYRMLGTFGERLFMIECQP
jgi:hypothetical protein